MTPVAGVFLFIYFVMDPISGLLGTLFSKGIQHWSASKEASLLKAALRDRLHREVRLNLEVWKLFESSKDKPEPSKLADLLSMDAFREVCTLNLPLSELMADEDLPEKAQQLLQQKGVDKPNKNYTNWARDIRTEVDLIERIWHRLHVLKVRQQLGGALGDGAYLIHLHRVLAMSLQTRKKPKSSNPRKASNV